MSIQIMAIKASTNVRFRPPYQYEGGRSVLKGYRLVQFIQTFQFFIAVDAVMAINDEPFMIKDI